MSDLNAKNFLESIFKRNASIDSDSEVVNIDNSILSNYYKSIAVHHPDLIVVLSSEGEILSENWERINKFLGYKTKKKMNYKDILSKETLSVFEKGFKSAISGNSERHQVKVKNKEAKLLHLNLTFIPIKKAYNDLPGVHVVIQDNT